jgi:hypothetical protein
MAFLHERARKRRKWRETRETVEQNTFDTTNSREDLRRETLDRK